MNHLDETDLQILRLLQQDASLTHKELSAQLHKSLATIHDRTRRLKEQGYIKKVVALLDRKRINIGLLAFCHVILLDHSTNPLGQFEKDISGFPEIMECFQVSGDVDFVLRVATADMEAYHRFYRMITDLPNVQKVLSFFVLSETKSETAFPLKN
jgi:Lrp/AsnC family transcriptional regulator, leucine-responsive regulatory protein